MGMSGARKPYFRYKNSNEIYTIDTDYSTDDYMVIYPVNYKHSSSPVYFFVLGSYNATLYAEAHTLATSGGSDYSLLTRFTDTATAIEQYYDNKAEFFGGGGVNTNRDYILTGFSYGATRALYAYTNLYQKITKLVNFNPWIGQYNTGYSSDPFPYLNTWHKTKLALILSDDTQVADRYKNVYTNMIEGDFSSKYWDMSREFTETGNTTSIGWGVNFVKEGGIAYTDSLPDSTITDYITRLAVGTTHTIDNWITSTTGYDTSYDVSNYLTGIKLISSYSSFDFAHHSNSGVGTHFHLTSIDTTSVATENVQAVGYSSNWFKWDFNPINLTGAHTITNEYSTYTDNIIITLLGTTALNENYYTIRNGNGDYIRLKTELITESYLRDADPIKIGIAIDSVAVYNGTADKTPYFWFIEDSSALGSLRRILTTADYLPITLTDGISIGFTYNSLDNGQGWDAYDIDFSLYDTGGGSLKWGHIDVGDYNNYKIKLEHTTNDLYDVKSNTWSTSSMYTPNYEIILYDTDRYFIKNTDILNNGKYLKRPIPDNTLLSTTTSWMMHQNSSSYFIDIEWDAWDGITGSADDYLFHIKAFQDPIPRQLGSSLSNYDATGTFENHLFYPQYMKSSNEQYILTFQRDGNLALFSNTGNVIYTSNTFYAGNGLFIQIDGNVVIYDDNIRNNNATNVARWSTGTSGQISFNVANNGKLIITDDQDNDLWIVP